MPLDRRERREPQSKRDRSFQSLRGGGRRVGTTVGDGGQSRRQRVDASRADRERRRGREGVDAGRDRVVIDGVAFVANLGAALLTQRVHYLDRDVVVRSLDLGAPRAGARGRGGRLRGVGVFDVFERSGKQVLLGVGKTPPVRSRAPHAGPSGLHLTPEVRTLVDATQARLLLHRREDVRRELGLAGAFHVPPLAATATAAASAASAAPGASPASPAAPARGRREGHRERASERGHRESRAAETRPRRVGVRARATSSEDLT